MNTTTRVNMLIELMHQGIIDYDECLRLLGSKEDLIDSTNLMIEAYFTGDLPELKRVLQVEFPPLDLREDYEDTRVSLP